VPLVLQPPLPLQVFLPLQAWSPVLQPPWLYKHSAGATVRAGRIIATWPLLIDVFWSGAPVVVACKRAAEPAINPVRATVASMFWWFEETWIFHMYLSCFLQWFFIDLLLLARPGKVSCYPVRCRMLVFYSLILLR